MAVTSRLIYLFTLSTLAVLICSFQSTPVAALSVEQAVHHRAHDALAKRKRSTTSNAKRCKPRSASSPAPASASSTPAASPTPAPAPAKASPSPSPASSSAPAKSTPASTNFGGNNPLGLRNKQAASWTLDVNQLPQYNPSLIYNWSPSCPDGFEKFNTLCCPMMWGERDVGTWSSTIMNLNPAPRCIMGMNEPELSSQGNMDPGRAVQLWRQYFNPLAAKGSYVFSPAPTSDPAGKVWLQKFFSQCPDCAVHGMAVHWYDVSPAALIAYLEDMHNSFGNRPVLLTEFACQNFNDASKQCSVDDVWAFEATVKPFIDNTDWMMGAAPFGIFAPPLPGGVTEQNGLANADGTPNALGKAWYSL